MVSDIDREENAVLSEFEGRLARDNFQIIQFEEDENQGTDILPVYKGKPTNFEELQSLVSSGELDASYWNKTRENYYKYLDEMRDLFQEFRLARKKLNDEIEKLKIQAVIPLVEAEMEHLFSAYAEPGLRDYLQEVREDIPKNIHLFVAEEPIKDEFGNPALTRYGINIIVDNKDTDEVPIVFENHPVFTNLFGAVETRFEIGGESRSNFMLIRAGSLIQASGGFLILRLEDLLQEEGIFSYLKRTIQTSMVEIQQQPGPFNIPGPILKPEPVKVDVKVIIIANENLYDILYLQDNDFYNYFKVTAEFDSVMVRNAQTTRQYIHFMNKIVQEEGLKSLDPEGICSIIRYGVRLSERKDRLSTRFSLIADIIREADYWAGRLGLSSIDGDTVNRAIEERNHMFSLPEEKLDELLLSGEVILSVTGLSVGRVNGIAIHDRGYYAFARPTLITARIAPGQDGVINIEREAGLSGELHDKGMFIVEGYLRSTYAQNFPLSITASICFEQSYLEVEGDSASSSEIYALLSAIAEVPLRQDIAVTGSVNQAGEIQAIGGITEKIEGFYTVCRKKGFTGTQGVIMPYQNIHNLILNKTVQDSIREGTFHIYPIATIDEGMEILTGMEAGRQGKDGRFPPGTLNALVYAKLKTMADRVKAYNA